jgi:hypothetical protein
MSKEKHLSTGTALFLLFVAIFADGMKFMLDLLFGIGLILDPFLITPITTFIFWITLNHNGIAMFSGKFGTASWVNEAVSLTPGLDALPDWTLYTFTLIASDHFSGFIQGIMS